jgi:hypothetical protein
MLKLSQLSLLLVFSICFLSACKAFMHGYTWSKAKNSYQLVTGSKNDFGDKRLEYNKGFHRNSALSNFLDCKCNDRGLPDFIYEYETKTKCRGIKLFYIRLDSVFVFEEPKKNNINSIQTEAREMDNLERQAFEKLATINKH